MNHNFQSTARALSALLSLTLTLALIPESCLAEEGSAARRSSAPGRSGDAGEANRSSKEGSELWSENCGRCHNRRSPEKFSDAQWDVIARHMRVRGNLTGEEERKIVEFLKSAN